MAHHSASFSFTLRVRLENRPGTFADLARAIADAGGLLDAIDLVRTEGDSKVRDVSVLATNADHVDAIVRACSAIDGVEVEHVSDRTFLLHLGGKIHMSANAPVKTRDDLSMAYTPGVARVCEAIAADPEAAWNLTIKRNTVAVVSDGSAVLGLGNIGPEAAMPVMEGKALLFKEFGGVDAWPICLSTTDTDGIVAAVEAIAPGFGGINLEDISAPRCFEIERRLRASLDIPVFHDDQHGTAVVVLAAFLNALRVVDKKVEEVKVVLTGVGAAGVAVTGTLRAAGVCRIVGCDTQGAVYRGRPGLEGVKAQYAEETNPENERGSADDVLAGADVYIGLSQPGAVTAAGTRRMAPRAAVVRDGEPDARDRTRGNRGLRHRDRDGPLRLSESDQQRARLPGNLPRRARRPRLDDHRTDGGRSRSRDRGDDLRGGARIRLHRPERLQPRGRDGRRCGGRACGGRGRRRPPRQRADRGHGSRPARRVRPAAAVVAAADDARVRGFVSAHGLRLGGAPWGT